MKKIDERYLNMDTKTYLKEKYQLIKDDLSNEVKRKVMAAKTSNFFVKLLRFILIFGFCFVILFPIFQKLSLAFRNPADLNNPKVIWIPTELTTLNIYIASKVLDFSRGLFNNIYISIICMILQIVVCSLAGYAFARLRFRGSNIFFIAILITLIIPPQTLFTARFILFTELDMTQKLSSLFVITGTGMGIRSALFIYLFRQFFKGLPKELEESSQIDGAGIFRTFFSVMLPNARGVMLTVAVFSFVWQWNDVYYAGLLQLSTESFPLLTMKLANTGERLGYFLKLYGLDQLVGDNVMENKLFVGLIANTAALICLAPLLVIYIFVQKYFVEGIERTGIVG